MRRDLRCDAMRRAPGWVRDHAMARLVQGTGRPRRNDKAAGGSRCVRAYEGHARPSLWSRGRAMWMWMWCGAAGTRTAARSQVSGGLRG